MRWAIWVCLAVCCGCNNQDAEQLTRIGRKAVSKMEDAAGGSRGRLLSGYQAVRGSLCDATLDSRVATRLLWEKSLADSEIEVQTVKPGTVKLVGRVVDFPQKQRAQDVAQNTAGVTEVVNELDVAQ
jgi:hyperosmotically inducible periplasmic protein